MSYTDDALLAKLSALNETQESIVTVAQWIMFHRRHADRTGQLWLQRLKDAGSSKRLNLVYLANEICQQSKARKKDEFLVAFSPFIADATATAYRGATGDVQQKLRRVVEVWRQRQIFEIPVQESVESRIDEIDKSRSNKRAGAGSVFSSGSDAVPMELMPLVLPSQEITRIALTTKTPTSAAEQDYAKLTAKDAVVPSAPVYAARLNALLKTLANAEGAVAESIKSRQSLISGLEKLLDTHRSTLATEEIQRALFRDRKFEIDEKKKDVEDSIMRGLPSSNPTTPVGDGPPVENRLPGTPDLAPPEIEALTPPRPEMEALTPIQEPKVEPDEPDSILTLNIGEQVAALKPESSMDQHEISPPAERPPIPDVTSLANLLGLAQQTSVLNYPLPKKRKLDNEDFPDLGGDAMEGLDADVIASLNGGA